jgi:hypothetical protein
MLLNACPLSVSLQQNSHGEMRFTLVVPLIAYGVRMLKLDLPPSSIFSNAALAIITANIRQQPAAAAWGIGFIAFRSKPGACQCNAIHIKQGGCPCTFYELQVLSWLWSCG